jgi:hypothetical protein
LRQDVTLQIFFAPAGFEKIPPQIAKRMLIIPGASHSVETRGHLQFLVR